MIGKYTQWTQIQRMHTHRERQSMKEGGREGKTGGEWRQGRGRERQTDSDKKGEKHLQ